MTLYLSNTILHIFFPNNKYNNNNNDRIKIKIKQQQKKVQICIINIFRKEKKKVNENKANNFNLTSLLMKFQKHMLCVSYRSCTISSIIFMN